MLELAQDLLPVLRAGEPVAAVTVTAVARSAPRGVGATLAVTASGAVIGSISGGCVEGDAVALAHQVLHDGIVRTAHFGFSDEVAHAAGLACGGAVTVTAYPVGADAATRDALERAADDLAVTVGVTLTGAHAGALIRETDLPLTDAVTHAMRWRESVTVADADTDVLVLSHAPRPRLIVLGAGEHAAALCRIADAAGFAVTVCDAWELLVTPARFPAARELVVALPHEYLRGIPSSQLDARTAICVLTHDERLDVPAITVALTLPVGFVGALGARTTVERRTVLLREAGVSEVDLARLHAPLGLDLGGSTPEESAIAALSEIVASRHDGSGLPLRDTTGPLHRRLDQASASCQVSLEPR